MGALLLYTAKSRENWRLTTGKNEKEYSWHVPAIIFFGMK